MLLNDSEINNRLNSLDNLFSRLRGSSSLSETNDSLAVIPEPSKSTIEIPSLPPNVDDLVDGIEDKLRTARITKSAEEVLDNSLEQLKMRLCEVENVRDLSKIATDMSKIINGQNQKDDPSKTASQVIIYKPVMVNETHYQAVQVNE